MTDPTAALRARLETMADRCDRGGPETYELVTLLRDAAQALASHGERWQPIETCPRDNRVRQFWIVPKTADESYTDTSGKPIVATFAPYLQRCGYREWSASSKAIYWCDDPPPPTTRQE